MDHDTIKIKQEPLRRRLTHELDTGGKSDKRGSGGTRESTHESITQQRCDTEDTIDSDRKLGLTRR